MYAAWCSNEKADVLLLRSYVEISALYKPHLSQHWMYIIFNECRERRSLFRSTLYSAGNLENCEPFSF